MHRNELKQYIIKLQKSPYIKFDKQMLNTNPLVKKDLQSLLKSKVIKEKKIKHEPERFVCYVKGSGYDSLYSKFKKKIAK